jgi:hypothetical protein
VGFGWDQDDTGLYDLLAKNSVLFDIRLLGALDDAQLAAYAGVVLPASVTLTARDTELLRRYKENGGRIYVLGDGGDLSSEISRREALEKVRGLAPGRLSLTVQGPPHVLGNLTRLGSGKALAIHLLNYGGAPVSGVQVRVHLDREFASLAGARPRLLTPDADTAGIAAHRGGQTVEFTLGSLDTYGVVVLE